MLRYTVIEHQSTNCFRRRQRTAFAETSSIPSANNFPAHRSDAPNTGAALRKEVGPPRWFAGAHNLRRNRSTALPGLRTQLHSRFALVLARTTYTGGIEVSPVVSGLRTIRGPGSYIYIYTELAYRRSNRRLLPLARPRRATKTAKAVTSRGERCPAGGAGRSPRRQMRLYNTGELE